MKYVIAGLLAILTVFSCYKSITDYVTTDSAYYKYTKEASSLEERDLYLDAAETYKKASDSTDDEKKKYDAALKTVSCYASLNSEDYFEDYCKEVINNFPNKMDCYLKLISYYQETEKYSELVPLLDKAEEQFPKEESLKEARLNVEKSCKEVRCDFNTIKPWFNDYTIASIMSIRDEDRDKINLKEIDEADGVIAPKAEETTEASEGAVDVYSEDEGEMDEEFLIIGPSATINVDGLYCQNVLFADSPNEFLVFDDNGEWKVINNYGYELENNKDVKFEEIGIMNEGFAWAKVDGKYKFINSHMYVSKQDFEDAGSIDNGYAYVKKNGKFALFSLEKMKESTKYEFEDIKADEYKRCFVENAFFGKKGGGYSLFNEKGKQISKDVYTDAKPFASGQPAAVKVGDKWGFAGYDGKIYIEPEYEDAQSFANGYAAVKVNGKWGYINRYNEMVVEPIYKDTKGFNSYGAAFVQGDDDLWDVIWMYTIQYR
ncbi:MAG: WG repeat-containing protein [Lachnospiraceae bacterium]|nr:WG repeat-containing protein [Lachnospiraceae bacterium]